MTHSNLWFIGLLVFSLTACNKTVLAPIPSTKADPAEDSIFSTLDFATPKQDEGKGLTVNGNDLYAVGFSMGNLDGTNQGDRDGILRHYNGGKLWALQFGTRDFDDAEKVVTDSSGNIYVAGTTFGPLGFQVGSFDIFLAKFNKDGKALWVRQFGTKNTDRFAGLAIDSNDRIYVLSDEGANNFVVRKFSVAGSLLKNKSVTLNNRPSIEPEAITVDNLNKVIVLTDWNNSGNGKGRDVRLFKYNSKLKQIWQRNYGDFNSESALDITTDSNNDIYFTISAFVQDEGGYFIKKNANGNTIYSRRLEHSDTSFDTFLRGITTDDNDNIYIAGDTGGSFTGFNNAGMRDIVVFKYSSIGDEQWVSQFDSGSYGSEGDDYAYDIAVSSKIYIIGRTSGNLLNGSNVSYGNWDGYIAQLKKNNGTILGVDQ